MSQLTETSNQTLELNTILDVKDKSVTNFNPACIRKRSNWSTVKNEFKMDNANFEPDFFLKDMPAFSPKLVALLDKIKSLDRQDQQKYGKTFKHFIFSDIKTGGQGAKMLASAFISNGWTLGYKSQLKNRDKIATNQTRAKADWGPLELLSQNELLQSRGDNFFLLSSVPVFDKPIGVRMKKEILSMFNSRPENIYGDLARIIIMDSGFKEGIDLFDIKYIHIFEPSINGADEKQVIGRGTRTCGQKGLEFHPTRGWPLDVFIYDLEIPEKLRFSLLGSQTAQELLMKAMNVDIRMGNFGHDVERLAILGSVDYELNKNVHNFKINLSDNNDETVLGGEGSLRSPVEERPESFENGLKFGYEEMKEYIQEHFSEYSWGSVTMENLCGDIPESWKNFSWDKKEEESGKKSLRSSQRVIGVEGSPMSSMSELSRSSRVPSLRKSELISLKGSPLVSSNGSPLVSSKGSLLTSTLKDSQAMSTLKGSQMESSKGSLLTSTLKDSQAMSTLKGSQMESSKGSLLTSTLKDSQLESSKGSQMESSKGSQMESLKGSQMELSKGSPLESLKDYQLESLKGSLKSSIKSEKSEESEENEEAKQKIESIKKLVQSKKLLSNSENESSEESEISDENENENERELIKAKIALIKDQMSKKGGATIVDYTPTQEFISNYFTPFAPVKGMLLYHSVGTGKTCTAIAAATKNFELMDYTILWVTRTTLKSDIWKNMFDQVCSQSIAERIKLGEKIPDIQTEKMRLLSRSWRIRPISYKQFSNLVSKKNQYYHQLVSENGEADPLQKTLLIIDEAHKLYGSSDLAANERPDTKALHTALMNSYTVSGPNSVRVLLMTATPITENPIELVQLINLCKPIEQQMPDTFDLFASQYLNEDGFFTNKGQSIFLDNIAGHISYLNREKDARQFSQPRIRRVFVPMVSDSQMKYVEDFDDFVNRSDNEDAVLKLQEELERTVKQMENEIGVITKTNFNSLYDICNDYTNVPKSICNTVVRKNITLLMKEIKDYIQPIKNKINDVKNEIINIKKGKQLKLLLIKKKIREHPALFAQYKASTYAAIRDNCSKTKIDRTQFIEAFQRMPEIIQIDNEIQASKEKIKILENQLKMSIHFSKQKIKQLKESLNDSDTSLPPPVEKTAIQHSIQNSQKDIDDTQKQKINEIQKIISKEKEYIANNENSKKELFSTLRKTLKNRNKIRKNMEAQAKNTKEKLNKTIKSLSDIKNEEIKLMVEKQKEIIRLDLREAHQTILRKDVEKLRKQREKEEYKIVKKTLKERENIEKRERKNLEKMREKEMKQQNINNKTRKQR